MFIWVSLYSLGKAQEKLRISECLGDGRTPVKQADFIFAEIGERLYTPRCQTAPK